MRVAAGSIAKKYLKELVGIDIKGYLSQIGNIKIKKIDLSEVDNNPFFCPDPEIIENIENLKPVIPAGSSDSASLDSVFELLNISGQPAPLAKLM